MLKSLVSSAAVFLFLSTPLALAQESSEDPPTEDEGLIGGEGLSEEEDSGALESSGFYDYKIRAQGLSLYVNMVKEYIYEFDGDVLHAPCEVIYTNSEPDNLSHQVRIDVEIAPVNTNDPPTVVTQMVPVRANTSEKFVVLGKEYVKPGVDHYEVTCKISVSTYPFYWENDTHSVALGDFYRETLVYVPAEEETAPPEDEGLIGGEGLSDEDPME